MGYMDMDRIGLDWIMKRGEKSHDGMTGWVKMLRCWDVRGEGKGRGGGGEAECRWPEDGWMNRQEDMLRASDDGMIVRS
jgi:hypothetical protein